MRLVLAALWVLAACSGPDPAPGSGEPSRSATPGGEATSVARPTASEPEPERTPAPTPFDAFASAPAAVAERDPLPSCGLEVVEREVGGDVYDTTARECFWAAWLEQRPAEFVSVPITVEGGRITEVYRNLADSGVEIYLDWSSDPFGPHPGWVRTECAALMVYANPAAPDVLFFEGTGCGPEIEFPET
jgi:hypothetical protein